MGAKNGFNSITLDACTFSFTWIGLNDLKNESDFRWSDGGNLTYKSMSPQMDYIKDERADQEMDCIASDQNGQWTTFHCDNKFYSICKKKLSTSIDHLEPKSSYNPRQIRTLHVGHKTLPLPLPKTVLEDDDVLNLKKKKLIFEIAITKINKTFTATKDKLNTRFGVISK